VPRSITGNEQGCGWHIDHHIPISSFDLSNEISARCALNWRNLVPMWAKDNLKKSATLPNDHVEFRMWLEEEVLKDGLECVRNRLINES